MQRVLITGATGMLGGYVRILFESRNIDLILPTRDVFNLRDSEQIGRFVASVKPDIILHLAAETNVDLCERDPRQAGLTNHIATRTIAREAARLKSYLVYISTSNVFGAKPQACFNELDIPQSVNYYGLSKYAGEREVHAFLPDSSLIVRAGWMIGGGSGKDHKFVGKILEQIKKGSDELRAVADKYGSITYAKSLADFIQNAVAIRRSGLVHFASKGSVSRFDLLKEIAAFHGFQGATSIALSSDFPLSAPRPFFETIDSIYLSSEDGLRCWQEDLQSYLGDEFEI